ncbi:MAG: hypothetical protein MUF87_01185 [Anaerolineae bacterium]|jgi:class 3 adenylate cyclase|nr:hypothetical protein [Anaerolineae bacterium]
MIQNVDPMLSVWRLVERVEKRSTILNHRRTMNLISYEIEDVTLIDHTPTRIFSGFQVLSKFLPQQKRYREMAKHAESIYVFGVPDIDPPPIPNITYVALDRHDKLAKEWFLVSYGPGYASALATEELTDLSTPDDQRIFKGLWTFDLSLVAILDEWLANTVNAQIMNPLDENTHNNPLQVRTLNNTINRMLGRIHREQSPLIRDELKTLIKTGLYPSILNYTGQPQPPQDSREQEVVILFTDLRNFTQISETMDSRQLVERIINPYLSIVSQTIYQYGGMVDKFLGDGVLAVFGLEGSPSDAVRQALAASHEILKQCLARDMPPIGIGIASGVVSIGRIGSEVRHEQTVIGDAVNTAQRLSQLGHNDAWLSHTIYRYVPHDKQHLVESRGKIELKGKSEPHHVYRLRG